MFVRRVMKLTESPPSKRTAGRPPKALGTTRATAAPLAWLAWFAAGDWSAQKSPNCEGSPASARSQSWRPVTLAGLKSVAFVKPAVTAALAASPALNALALTVVVPARTKGAVYGADDSVGSVPSSV